MARKRRRHRAGTTRGTAQSETAAAQPHRGTAKRPAPTLQDQLATQRALDALYLMRSKGLSLTRAAQEAHADPRTVRKRVGTTVVQTPSGRYAARPGDRMVRQMHFLTPQGVIAGEVRGSRNASLVAKHAAAVDRFLGPAGDPRPLRAFRGKSVRVDGVWMPFLTDLRLLKRLEAAGEVAFEELYVFVR